MKKKFICFILILFTVLSYFLVLSSADENSSFGKGKETYDLAIITCEQFVDEFQLLAIHKKTVGIETLIKSTNEIYDEYSGVDAAEQIKYFIKDAVENYGISFVMLAGDESIIQVRVSNLNDSVEMSFPSDLYYADLYNETGDFCSWDSNGNGIFAEWNFTSKDILDLYPDVSLGRIPCSNQSEVERSIYKIITYEKTGAGDWFDNVLLCGGDTCISEDAYNEGECINDEIKSILADDSYSFDKLWASNGNLSVANITATINEGVGFIDFSGLGNSTSWMTHPHNDSESYLPNGGYTTNDVLNLSNNEKIPAIILGGGHCSDIGSDAMTLSEAFLFHPEGGSIGVFGSTSNTWYYCNDDYADGLFGYLETSLFSNYNGGLDTLGELWTATITDYINNFPVMNDGNDCKTVEEFVLLGDPSLRLGGYNVSYPVHNIDSGNDFYTIQEAINDNDTQPYDTILVDSGVYYENVLIDKPLHLVGEDKDSTIIDAQHIGSVINVTSNYVTISKFTLKNTGNVSETSGYDDSGITLWNMPIDYVKNCTIHHNDFVDCFVGVTLTYTNNISIHNNSFSLVNDMYGNGLNIDGTNTSIITNNHIFNCTDGIYVGYDSYNNLIFHNIMENNSRHGIRLYSGSSNGFNTIKSNQVTDNQDYGIFLDRASNNTVSNNYINGNNKGITLRFDITQDNLIFKNYITGNSEGIYLLQGPSNNTIIENNIYSNVGGIKMFSGCEQNLITENLINDNSYAFSLQSSNINNQFFHNNFINNTNPSYDDGSNHWDNGYPSGGNYWEDYTGVDADGDGIGDTPFQIFGGNNQDNYPLINPFGSVTNIDTGEVFFTIQEAIDDLNTLSGHSIYVRNDIYLENLTVDKSIKLIGENKYNTIIDGQDVGCVINITASNVSISNFMIKNSGNFSYMGYSDAGVSVITDYTNRLENCTFYNNIITDCLVGIRIINGMNMTVHENVLKDCGIGVSTAGLEQFVIDHNEIMDNERGLYIGFESQHGLISENIISNNSQRGLVIYYSKNNTIWSNTIKNNSGYGIEIKMGLVSENNSIHHNNFVDNSYPGAFDYYSNDWDYNYWSWYSGSDNNNDGIGDIPHIIYGSGTNQDYHPLMNKNAKPALFVWIDEDFNSSTLGWQIDHFNVIQNGIDAVADNGTVYVFSGNYYENLVIDKTINLIGEDKNNTIINASKNGPCITVYSDLVEIKKFTIKHGGSTKSPEEKTGIVVHSNNNLITECNISDNTDCGIFLNYSSFNQITHTLLYNNKDEIGNSKGIFLFHSSNNNINHNTISSNTTYSQGILIRYYSVNNYVHNNTFLESAGIHLGHVSDNTIHQNTFEKNGIYISGFFNNWNSHSIIGNMVESKPIYYYRNSNNLTIPTDAGQVILANCNNCTIQDISLTNMCTGVALGYSSDTKVINNSISSSLLYGINLWGSINNNIIKNTITSSQYNGIFIWQSTFNTLIQKNKIHSNMKGISLKRETHDTVITQNSIMNNTNDGISIDASSNNTIYENTIQHNQDKGINIWIANGPCKNNKIYHNTFINNTPNAHDEDNNIWDNGYPSGGNYWDDYTGSDADNDGIGDIPYHISNGDSQDLYPFVNPHGWLPPLADFMYDPLKPTVVDEVNFIDMSTDEGTIVNWSWDFGDGYSSTTQNPTHQYSEQGTYTVNLTVWDDENNKNETSKTISVINSPPLVNFSFLPVVPDVNEVVHFSDESVDIDGTIDSWNWEFDDGDVSTLQHPIHMFTQTGIYDVVLTVSDNHNDSSTMGRIVPVNVSLYPVVNLTKGWNLFSIPANTSVHMDEFIILQNNSFCSWSAACADWNPSGSLILDISVFTWNRSGYYQFTDTMQPGFGCWIYVYQDCQLLTEELPLNPDSFITHLETGWNLIGNPHQPSHDISMLLVEFEGVFYNWSDATSSQNPTNISLIDSNIFGWNPNQFYETIAVFEPAKAYWVYAYTKCDLHSSTWI